MCIYFVWFVGTWMGLVGCFGGALCMGLGRLYVCECWEYDFVGVVYIGKRLLVAFWVCLFLFCVVCFALFLFFADLRLYGFGASFVWAYGWGFVRASLMYVVRGGGDFI